MRAVLIVGEESKLQQQVAALREANEDLRLSAVRCKAMYECAARRCAELEAELRGVHPPKM